MIQADTKLKKKKTKTMNLGALFFEWYPKMPVVHVFTEAIEHMSTV